jgi:hypothetical protein
MQIHHQHRTITLEIATNSIHVAYIPPSPALYPEYVYMLACPICAGPEEHGIHTKKFYEDANRALLCMQHV